MKTSSLCSLVICALVLNACGKKHSGKGNPANDDNAPADIESFNAEQTQQFEEWKGSLLKSCSYTAAMPWLKPDLSGKTDPSDNEPATLYIDAKVLSEKLKNSSLLIKDSGEFAYFGAPERSNGGSIESRSFRITRNGQTTGFSVKAEHAGSKCVLTYGEKTAYSAELYSVQAVDLFLDSQDLQELLEPKQLQFTVDTFDYQPDPSKADKARGASVEANSLFNRIQSALLDKSRLAEFLALEWGISQENAQKFFKSGDNTAPAAFALPSDSLANTAGRVFGTEAALAAFATQADQSIEVTPIYVLLDRIKGEVEPRPFHFQVTAKLSGQTKGTGGLVNVQNSITAFKALGSVDYNNESAQNCFQTRYRLATGYHVSKTPAAGAMFEEISMPCEAYFKDISQQLANVDSLRSILLGEVIKLRLNVGGFGYGGWDEAFSRVAWILAQAQKDLETLLVPPASSLTTTNEINNRTSMLKAFRRFSELSSALGTDPAMHNVYESELLKLTMKWLFTVKTPGEKLGSDVKSTLQNMGYDFVEPTLGMLDDLGSSVTAGTPGVLAAACGALYSDQQKNAFYEVEALTSKQTYLSDWATEARKKVLINCWQVGDLASYKITAQSLVAWFDKEKAQLPAYHGTYDLEAPRFANQAMSERWTKTAFDVAQQIQSYAVVSSKYDFCDATSNLPTQILRCEGLRDAVRATTGGMLFAAYGKRYGELAGKLQTIQREWFSDFQYFDGRYALESAFFDNKNALWSACDNDEFARRVQNLDRLLTRYRTTSSYQNSQDIKAALTNCQ